MGKLFHNGNLFVKKWIEVPKNALLVFGGKPLYLHGMKNLLLSDKPKYDYTSYEKEGLLLQLDCATGIEEEDGYLGIRDVVNGIFFRNIVGTPEINDDGSLHFDRIDAGAMPFGTGACVIEIATKWTDSGIFDFGTISLGYSSNSYKLIAYSQIKNGYKIVWITKNNNACGCIIPDDLTKSVCTTVAGQLGIGEYKNQPPFDMWIGDYKYSGNYKIGTPETGSSSIISSSNIRSIRVYRGSLYSENTYLKNKEIDNYRFNIE